MPADNPTIEIVIPARYGSSRFPGKPLALLAGKPVIQHVYERAAQVPANARVLVATDDVRIFKAVENFGGLAVMVPDPCRTGTDRVAAAVRTLTLQGSGRACNVVVNLQGDEIPLSPDFLMDLINPFLAGTAEMGTLRRAMGRGEAFSQSSIVKVVTDQQGRALYFSRSPIPYVRDHASSGPSFAFLHAGVYIFRRATLERFASLPTGTLEQAEQLEQLRALERGIPIHVWDTVHASLRIDTPEDLENANKSWDRLMAGQGRPPSPRSSSDTTARHSRGSGNLESVSLQTEEQAKILDSR